MKIADRRSPLGAEPFENVEGSPVVAVEQVEAAKQQVSRARFIDGQQAIADGVGPDAASELNQSSDGFIQET